MNFLPRAIAACPPCGGRERFHPGREHPRRIQKCRKHWFEKRARWIGQCESLPAAPSADTSPGKNRRLDWQWLLPGAGKRAAPRNWVIVEVFVATNSLIFFLKTREKTSAEFCYPPQN